MQLEITSKQDEPLFHRTRVLCKVESKNTPTRVEVKRNLAAKLGADSKKLVLEKIEPSFGGKEFKVIAKLYSDAEFIPKVEKKYLRKRNDALEKVEEKPKEEKPAEAPSEEKKEEPKAEEKKEEKSE